MTADPWQHFTAERIAEVTGCPIANVREHWPRLVAQLEHCKINDRPTQIAMIGTVAIETASRFQPIHEFKNADGSTPPYWHSYGGGAEYHGRGFIQLTHLSNYQKYGRKVAELWGAAGTEPDFDLAGNPDNALNPDVSAAVAALYFRDHGGDRLARIPAAARAGDWREVRRLVQGGSAGLERLVRIANALAATDETGPTGGTKYIFPVQGYVGAITDHWGISGAVGGTDIFAPKGTPVVAVASGRVVYRVEGSPMGGNAVQIEHDADGLESYYAHGDRPPAVQMGQRVTAGDFIFGVGDTGNAAGKGHHLHFGMGEDINSGSGVQSGLGTNFNAVALLRSLLAATPPGGTTDQRDEQISGLLTAVAHLADVVVPKATTGYPNSTEAMKEAQQIREQFVGKKPAA